MLGIHQGREFRQQHAPYRRQIALALQHTRKARQIGLEPVLLRIAVGREPQVVDHGVDVVFQLRHFPAGLHLNGSCQVALGHGGRDFSDGAHLVGQVIGEQVDVARQILPRAGRSGHVRLAAQPPFHAHFASDGRDLIRKRSQRVRSCC